MYSFNTLKAPHKLREGGVKDFMTTGVTYLYFCKMTKHDLVQFNTEVYYQKCCYLYQSNVYILFN